ncbi:MAG: hypothetical protein HKN21_12495 [Candidatus Eisenbacteria bacterium]|uniref:Uncharacterized protein n=1 Tax=Eiseniibacteriota bacterium TaxID=2212470 RepID=A0A7Y2EG59_UNCEI|nr:hypothetical protein [Candidatus Eisenbacteria bacterium]
MDNTRILFTDLTDDARSVKPSYYFMMRSLLHSRIDTGLSSNQEVEDEDVNVYLANLLQSFSDPGYLQQAEPYLHRYDHEVFRRMTRSTDSRLKYKIYKTNADFLLVSIGVFDNSSQTLLNRVSSNSGSKNRMFEPTEEATLSRGRTFYQFAYSYSQMVPKKNPAVSEVLQKLAGGFDRYIQILAHLRGEYLDIIHELSRGEVYHLERSVNREKERKELRKKQDEFLDAYADWKREPSDQNTQKLQESVDAVRAIDPEFTFSMDSDKNQDGSSQGDLN